MATRNPQQTRERLLQTAFQQIHAHGFQGMRVDEVLRLSGLQKGAFYHHFDSKMALGYAVLDEQIKSFVESVWLRPLQDIQDPIREIPPLLDELGAHPPPAMRDHGCPLNNLAQEMASQDDGFRERLEQVFAYWIDGFEAAFVRGKAAGRIRPDIDTRATARFLVAVLEGCIGVRKVDPSPEQWAACRSQISTYLTALEPDA